MKAFRNLKLIGLALVLLMIVGTAGFHFIEGWSWFDGLYMVVTTISTIGYGEIHPLSHAGRVFNLGVIVCGVALVMLAIGSLTQALLEFEFGEFFGRRKMQREITNLHDHYIICGAGRVGRSVARELERKRAPFVILDTNTQKLETYAAGWLSTIGDATSESTLREVGIDRARGLVAAATTDATNIYIVLTARSLNAKLKIIARASEDAAQKHLMTAGATSVISPYDFAGHRIAQSFLRPNVLSFLDVATSAQGHLDLEIEELPVAAHSALDGQTLGTSGIRQQTGVIVLGIQPPSGSMKFNPAPEDRLHADDLLIVMGEPAALRKLREMASSNAVKV
jgi:voltage-gated potassium channel